MRRATALVAALVAAVSIAACGGGGESQQDKAKKTVCSARADITKQVNTLKGLTPSTFTTSAVTDSLTAIKNDLSKIQGAHGTLSAERKQTLKAANQEFESQVSSIAKSLVSSTSVSDAATQLSAAVQKLADTYTTTLTGVDCP